MFYILRLILLRLYRRK